MSNKLNIKPTTSIGLQVPGLRQAHWQGCPFGSFIRCMYFSTCPLQYIDSAILDFNERNLCITSKLLSQWFHYHTLVYTFTKFYHKYKDIILKFGCTCRKLIKYGLSQPNFYGNVVNKARKFEHNHGTCQLYE